MRKSKKENEVLQSTNKVLTSENEYLKKIVEINKAILETEKDNSSFKITKVTGNRAEKTIAITFLVEEKDENKKMTIEDISIADIEGKEYEIDFYKSSRPYPELDLNTPIKLTFSFKNIENQPLFKNTKGLERNVLEMWLLLYCKNAFPTKGRNCIFAARFLHRKAKLTI